MPCYLRPSSTKDTPNRPRNGLSRPTSCTSQLPTSRTVGISSRERRWVYSYRSARTVCTTCTIGGQVRPWRPQEHSQAPQKRPKRKAGRRNSRKRPGNDGFQAQERLQATTRLLPATGRKYRPKVLQQATTLPSHTLCAAPQEPRLVHNTGRLSRMLQSARRGRRQDSSSERRAHNLLKVDGWERYELHA